MAQNEERVAGMPLKQRDCIKSNMQDLINSTNYEKLMSECVRTGILNDNMRKNIDNETDRHRELFMKITRRGPSAYGNLVAVLKKLKYDRAAHILEMIDQDPFISISEQKNARNIASASAENTSVDSEGAAASRVCSDTLTPYTKPVQGKQCVVKSDKIHDSPVGVYPMKSKNNRGVLLMVNIINFPEEKRKRNGANVDGDALIHLFRELGFIVFAYEDLNHKKFIKILENLLNSDYVRNTESFVLVLMSHGNRANEVDKVEFTDGSIANVRDIINKFQSSSCPYLVGKPKVLMFPFCRGSERDKGVKKIETDGIGITSYGHNVPTLSDTLVCYASAPGFEAHRVPETGSWYVENLYKVMAADAHNTHLEDILKKTHAEIARLRTEDNTLQTGNYDNIGFNKHLYFNPGYSKD